MEEGSLERCFDSPAGLICDVMCTTVAWSDELWEAILHATTGSVGCSHHCQFPPALYWKRDEKRKEKETKESRRRGEEPLRLEHHRVRKCEGKNDCKLFLT